MNESLHCRNCNAQLNGNFCHECGQRSSVYKVTFKETFQDLFNGLFTVNAPFIITIKLLFLNPGELFRNFLNGRRKNYYKPVSFFIVTTLLYVIVRSIINYNPMTTAGVNVQGEILADAGKYMVKNINNIMFLFVFTLGVFLKLFFFKKNSLAEFIAIAFYAVGVYTLIGLMSMFFLKYVGPRYKSIPILIFLLYIIYALTSFFKSRSFLTILKSILAYFLSFSLYTGIGFLVSFLIIWLKTK